MKKSIYASIICLISGLLGFTSRAFPIDVKGVDTMATAVVIYDLTFNTPIVMRNADVPLIPASIMKAVTSASVLNLASSDEQFYTVVVAEGRIDGSTLKGNLVIKTTGDPTIESEHFPAAQHFADSISAALKARGITEIEGKVIVDETDFVHTGTPPGWMKEDLTWPYGTDLHGANYRDNKFILRMPSRTTVPHVPDLKINHINRKAKARSVKRTDGSGTVTISGRIPSKGWSDRLSTPNPASVMQYEVAKVIADSGITIQGKSLDSHDQTTLIYTHISPSFGEILQSLMYRSDNLMAEGMLRSLTPGASRNDAIAEEMKIWRDKGVDLTGVKIEDGSGLSRNDRVTAQFMLDVLKSMLAIEYGSDYTSLFPRAGYDGTMRNTFIDTPLEGVTALKTGSMKGVRSFAGYHFNESGQPSHIIIVISNNLKCSGPALKKGIESLLLEYF
ncbi:MAG: D-alanyl-D-alanine carboxypeptidase/D-alanyl-D-alanine-endopeptidase [Lachnoclostridium sp.]|nr:D-alanyl-D-alanine carboxypeptidase/D-alanyl-D-alanine-endopeptidase [Lachnoclostridium sp.]